MIRRLRRRHLWMVLAVAAVTGLLYLAALAVRPAPAVQDVLPPRPPGAAAPEAAP